MVKAADKAPSFFPLRHNIGMLELVNSDYVASESIDLKTADAAAWGLIESDDTGGGGGGSGSGDDLPFCPVVDSKQCSDHGTCNSMSGQCLCYIGWTGADCSTQADEELNPGSVTLSDRFHLGYAFDMTTESTSTMTLTNTGQASLNWYFFIISPDDGTDIYLSLDASSVPSWISMSSSSGTVAGFGSSQVTFTFKVSHARPCSAPIFKVVTDTYHFIFNASRFTCRISNLSLHSSLNSFFAFLSLQTWGARR